ncbi:MAG: hypothetical protein NC095_09200 [Muribaculum sp.]|nr:hypothetical protein [Muribaculum sp.]
MKKFFLTLIALVATSIAGYAQISLDDAYNYLSSLPGMSEQQVGSVTLAPGVQITGMKSVSGSMARYQDEFINAYESLPIDNMLIGVNNQQEMACSFSEPSDTGVYNVFFIIGEKGGKLTAAYGQTNADGLEAIANCDVSLDGKQLEMAVAPQIDMIEVIEIDYAQR